ncbi:DUF3073 domain-containing protein [Cellulomonas biazotea]|jgi:hypothetical protein|uniref:DUF3073 domain-containing protein n=1 Tax=Cellulomonas biazotea TaxID=1709 RepID=A0A402DNB4_9CELL|nr:DUF3073 domain-containing protein [Cellulomonas biazotea]GCE75610.1 hypothetical protein CBZ_06660 [Cellulomonas biazotea]
MGRGRQKAKQTKVARELKYFSPETNYRALEQELGSLSHNDLGSERRGSAIDTGDRPGEDDDYRRWPDDDR